MINEINILHECHSRDFTCHTGKEPAGLLGVVSYHHEIVVELGEYSFYTFAELLVCPRWRTPVFLIQPIWNFKSNIGCLKKILLNFSTEITFVSKHHAVMIFPAYIIEEMEVMDACRRHVKRMYDTTYAADSMEFISIIVQTLRGAVSPIRSGLDIVAPHYTTLRPCVLTDLYGLGVNAEYVFCAVNGDSHILADLFGKPGRQLAAYIELTTADQVWQIVLAFIVQAMKQQVFTVQAESLGSYAESDDFEVGKLWDNPTPGHISKFIHTISGEILAYSEDSDEICYEVAHKQSNSS